MTDAMVRRQSTRTRRGRYADYPRCEVCGKHLVDYATDDRVNGVLHGLGLVLCDRCGRRVAGMDDQAALDLLQSKQGVGQ